MFGSKNGKTNPNATDTVIGEGTIFEGKIKTDASIRIDGKMTGDLDCLGDVTIGEKGIVQSNIVARDVYIAGSLAGHITAKGKVTITKKGQMTGNITYDKLIIEEGAVFQGNSGQANKAEKKNHQNQSSHLETQKNQATRYQTFQNI